MAKRTKIEQEFANRRKVVRTAVRLKHSLEADNELNDVLDETEKEFSKNVLKGLLPPPLDIKKLLKLSD